MKKIIVGFSKSKKNFTIASWLVRLYQWTDFSHTYIRLLTKGKFPSDKILHASEGLVQNMSGTQFDKKHKVVKEFEIEVPNIIVNDKYKDEKTTLYKCMINTMHETSGDNYSVLQNIGILYVCLMKKILNKRVKNPWPQGWNCSEFVATILATIYQEFDDIDPNTVTPKEIEQILSKMAKKPNCKIRLVKQ